MAASYEIPVLLNGSIPAGASLTSSQFLGMTLNSSGQAIVQTSQGGNIVGVLQNNPTATGQQTSIMQLGVTKMIAGAALATPGTAVMVNTSGQAIAQTGSNVTIGRTLTAASGSGVTVTVLLIPN